MGSFIQRKFFPQNFYLFRIILAILGEILLGINNYGGQFPSSSEDTKEEEVNHYSNGEWGFAAFTISFCKKDFK